jgi:hypothetical protein
MSSDSRHDALAQAAKRAESMSGCLVGSLVAAWRRAFQQPIEDALQCSPADVVQLSLCLRPRVEAWGADVGEIATAIGIERSLLEGFFRKARTAEGLAMAHPVDEELDGRLMAARDRDENS